MAKGTHPDYVPFHTALLRIMAATKWTQVELARRFGVSTKTVSRWVLGKAFPVARVRHGLVYALGDLEAGLLTVFANSIGLPSEVAARVAKPTAVNPVAARATIEAAITEAADQLNAPPGRTRRALFTFVQRLAEAGIDRVAARDLLAAPRAPKKRVP
jgi:transcriptional regulator with XRE-family HTH domain